MKTWDDFKEIFELLLDVGNRIGARRECIERGRSDTAGMTCASTAHVYAVTVDGITFEGSETVLGQYTYFHECYIKSEDGLTRVRCHGIGPWVAVIDDIHRRLRAAKEKQQQEDDERMRSEHASEKARQAALVRDWASKHVR